MHELPDQSDDHSPAEDRRIEQESVVDTAYQRLLTLCRRADSYFPEEEANIHVSDFEFIFADGASIKVYRFPNADGYLRAKGPVFTVYGKASVKDRATAQFNNQTTPFGKYTLSVSRPVEGDSPRATYSWERKAKYGVRDEEVDSTSDKFPLALFRKTVDKLNQDPVNIKSHGKSREQDLPPVVRDLRIAFQAYKKTKEDADAVLGNRPRVGSLEAKFSQRHREVFYSFVSKVSDRLPDTILYATPHNTPTLRIKTNRGDIVVGGGGRAHTLYYLPHHDAILRIDPFTKRYKPEYDPTHPDFPGIDAIKNMPEEDNFGAFTRLTHVVNQAWGELSDREISIITAQIDQLLSDEDARRELNAFQDLVAALDAEREKRTQEEKEKHASNVRTRILAILETYRKYPVLFMALPQRMDGPVVYEQTSNDTEVVKRLFLIKDEGKLKKVPVEKDKDRDKADFSRQEDASLTDWLEIGLIVLDMKRILPESVRDEIS